MKKDVLEKEEKNGEGEEEEEPLSPFHEDANPCP